MRVRLFFFCVLWSVLVCAQDENAVRQRYMQAEEEYKIGRFEEAARLLDSNMNHFTGTLKTSAYRLMSLCYLGKDDMQRAEEYVSLLLKEDPYYNVTLQDPLRFADMVERFKKGQVTITTASQQEETVDEAPVPVTLITEEMIKASGARNLREVLMTFIPGITAIEGEECNISMRGAYSYSQENVLIMRNGHRLNSHTSNSVAPDYRISLDNIKQIEVLRGAASSLYGNVALTAVVNIITKSGGDIDGIMASYGMGSQNTYKGSLLFGKRFMNSDITIWGSVYSTKGYRYDIDRNSPHFFGIIPKDGYIYVDGYNHRPAYDFGLRYQWGNIVFSASHQYSKRVHTYNSLYILSTYDYDRYEPMDGVKPGRGISSTYAELAYSKAIKNGNISAAFSVDYENTNLYNVLGDSLLEGYDNIGQFYFPEDEYLKDSLRINSGAFELQNWKNMTIGGELKLIQKYRLGNAKGNLMIGSQFEHVNSFYNEMSLGGMYNRIALTTVNERTGIYVNGKENLFSIYGQIKHNFPSKFIFNGGLRYDYKKRYNGRKMNIISPRLSLIYLPADSWNMKLSYAHSYVDAPYFYRVSKVMYLGNEKLNPQHMDSYQLSSTMHIKPLYLTYDSNLFYNHSRDIIIMAQDGYSNSGTLDMVGWENSLAYKTTHLSAYANMVYQRLLHSENYSTLGNKVCAVPNFVFNLAAEKELHPLMKNLWIGTKILVRSKQVGQISKNFVFKGDQQILGAIYELKSSCLVDLGIRYAGEFADFNFRCYNVFNTKYQLGGDRVPVPQPGRSFLASILFKIK